MKRRQKVYHRKKWYFLLVVDLELEPVHCCYYAYGRNCATVQHCRHSNCRETVCYI